MTLPSEPTRTPDLQPIRLRYLLVLNIPVYKDAAGACWTDRLWHKDLLEHVEYLDDFTLACPFIAVRELPPDMVRIDDLRVKFVELPGRHKLSLRLPVTAWRLWRAVGHAQVVHTGLGGWLPISVCNLTSTMATWRRRYLMVVVESSPWRLVPGRAASLRERARAVLSEWVNRRTIDRVDLAVFTQAKYRDSLMTRRLERGHIIHASWIDASIIVDDDAAAADRSRKLTERPHTLKLLFAGRVTAAKGVPVLLQAMRQLDAQGTDVELHVIGEGDLLDTCRDSARTLEKATLRLLEPMPYGPQFFNLVRDYDAVVVPSVTDEQPRIVYDAYSQGVPVLASGTDGLRDCIADGVTGRLCAPNDAAALTGLLTWAAQHRDELGSMVAACLRRARAMTHREMHRARWQLLTNELKHVG